MKPSKKMIKWMLRSLLTACILCLIAIVVAVIYKQMAGAYIMTFTFIVLGLAYNRVAMEEDHE